MKPGSIIYTGKTKRGRQLTIRALDHTDYDVLLQFANDLIEEDTFVMLSGVRLTKDEEDRYVSDSIGKVEKDEKIHLIALVDGICAGSCDVRRFDRRKSHVGEIGISVSKQFRDDGVGRILLTVLISEAKRLGLRLLFLHCFENNGRALYLYESLGFIRSGVVPDMYAYKGGFAGEVTLYLQIKNSK